MDTRPTCPRFLAAPGAVGLAIVACMSLAPRHVCAAPVYTDYFIDDNRHPGWVLPPGAQAGLTPAGVPTFGPFTNDPVSLRLDKLPDHQLIIIAIDLQIVGPWPGLDKRGKLPPTTFSISLDDQVDVFHSSFAMESDSVQRTQAFPDFSGNRTHAAGSGALEVATLGYGSLRRPADAVYRLAVPIRHNNSSATFTLKASNLPPGAHWALGSIAVECFITPEGPAGGLIGPTPSDFAGIYGGYRGFGSVPPLAGDFFGHPGPFMGGGGGGGGGPPGGGGGGGGTPPVVPTPGAATVLLSAAGYYLLRSRLRERPPAAKR